MLCFCLSLIHLNVFSQDIKYSLEVEELEKKYKDESYIILDALIEINIVPDEFTHAPSIQRREKLVFLSLKDYVVIKDMNYHSNNSTIEKLKGNRFILTSGDVPDNEIFHDDKKFALFSKEILKKGDKTKLETIEKFKDYRFFPSQYFFYNVPVVHEEIRINVDPSIKYKVFTFNFDSLNIERNFSMIRKFYSESYILNDVKPSKKEEWATPVSCNYPHLLVNIQSFDSMYGDKIKALESTQDLYNMYKNFLSATKNDTIALRPILDSITTGIIDPIQRVRGIYKWVQQKIRYIAFEYGLAGYIPANALDVVENRYGDCKGVANLLKTFLRMEGLDARICWINTKQNPYDYSIPSFIVDNHMICALIYDGKPLFLDATNNYLGVYDLGEYMQGKQVLIENGKSPWLYQIPILNVKTNLSQYNYELTIKEKTLIGTVNAQFKGNKKGFLKHLINESDEELDEVIANVVFNRSNSINWNKEDDVLQLKEDSVVNFASNIQIKSNVLAYGNRMFIQISPMQKFQVESIDTSRVCDVQFMLRNYSEQNINLAIPSNYTALSVPNDTVLKSPIGSVSYSYNVNDSSIQYNCTYVNNSLVMPVEEVRNWNAFVKKVNIEEKKRIVLQKIN